jgi:hypothetical protein
VDENAMALLCLSEDQNLSSPRVKFWTPHMRVLHQLLMAQESRIQSLDIQMRELTEHLDSSRELWNMRLDSVRNLMIRLNLHLQFVGVAMISTTFPAGCVPLCIFFLMRMSHRRKTCTVTNDGTTAAAICSPSTWTARGGCGTCS